MISKISYQKFEGESIAQKKEISKKVETLFLTEMLKVMLKETSLTQDRSISTYMTVLIPEIATMMAEREIGIGKFLVENPNFMSSISKNEKIELKPISENLSSQKKKMELELKEGEFSKPNELSLPVKGDITSRFGFRIDPLDGKRRHHNGIDIAVPEGTNIKPLLSGKVVYSGYSKGYGNCVIIEHEGGIQTIYAHNSKNLVKVGDTVTSQTVIALSGSTGRTTGPHLHFEVRKNGKALDPLMVLNNYQKSTIY